MRIPSIKSFLIGFRIICLSIPLITIGQEFATDWTPANLGARSTSLGRSTVMDNGSTALFHNPAALSGVGHAELSAYYSLDMPTQTSGHLDALSSRGKVETTPVEAPLNLIFVFPNSNLEYEDLSLSYGVGVSQFYQWVNEHSWNYVQEGSTYVRSLDRSPGINVFHLGAGFNPWKTLRVGMTFHYVPGGEYFSKDVLYVDESYVSGLAETFNTGHLMFFRLGALLKLGSALEAGLTLVSPYEWMASDYWTNDNTNLREHSLFKSPLNVGYGFSYIKGAFQIQYEGSSYAYSKMEVHGVSPELDNGQGMRIGLEYGRKNKFRTGFYSEGLPTSNSVDSEPIKMTGFTFGFGTSFGKLSFDFAVDHYSWNNAAFNQPLLDQLPALEDEVSGNKFIVEVGYKFLDGVPKF